MLLFAPPLILFLCVLNLPPSPIFVLCFVFTTPDYDYISFEFAPQSDFVLLLLFLFVCFESAHPKDSAAPVSLSHVESRTRRHSGRD